MGHETAFQDARRGIPAALVTVILATIVFPLALAAQTVQTEPGAAGPGGASAGTSNPDAPWILVVRPANLTGNAALDPLSATIADTWALTLTLLGDYELREPPGGRIPEAVIAGDETAVSIFAEALTLDYIVYGAVAQGEEGYLIRARVWDTASGEVSVDEIGLAESLLDTFDIADELTGRFLSAFSGRRVAFGSVQVVREGWPEGQYRVFVDGVDFGTNPSVVRNILIGERAVSVVAVNGPQAGETLYEDTVDVSEGRTSRLSVAMTAPPPEPVPAEEPAPTGPPADPTVATPEETDGAKPAVEPVPDGFAAKPAVEPVPGVFAPKPELPPVTLPSPPSTGVKSAGVDPKVGSADAAPPPTAAAPGTSQPRAAIVPEPIIADLSEAEIAALAGEFRWARSERRTGLLSPIAALGGGYSLIQPRSDLELDDPSGFWLDMLFEWEWGPVIGLRAGVQGLLVDDWAGDTVAAQTALLAAGDFSTRHQASVEGDAQLMYRLGRGNVDLLVGGFIGARQLWIDLVANGGGALDEVVGDVLNQPLYLTWGAAARLRLHIGAFFLAFDVAWRQSQLERSEPLPISVYSDATERYETTNVTFDAFPLSDEQLVFGVGIGISTGGVSTVSERDRERRAAARRYINAVSEASGVDE